MNILISTCAGCNKTILSVVNDKLDGRHINDCDCLDPLDKIITLKLTRNEWIELVKEGTLISSLID